MDTPTEGVPKEMWRPNARCKTKLDEYRELINTKYKLKLDNYQQLWEWSVENYSDFWKECWSFFNIVHSKSFEEVVDTNKRIEEIPEWFKGAQLNYAENLLRYKDDRVALYAVAEGKEEVEEITFKQLNEDVCQLASAMKKMGVKSGDRVVGYIPNGVMAVEAMLAASSIGAIWSSTSPDFGVSGVLDRFSQISPKVIFSVDAVVYNGKVHNHLSKLEQVVQKLTGLEKVVVVPYVKKESEIDISAIPNSTFIADFLKSGSNEDGSYPELIFEQLPFNHPLFIMYSSGTTGAPKCMVHSAGGTLIQHLKEHVLHGNMSREDVIIYYTTTGWMMWNWLVTSLAAGASVVLYDGSPLVPTVNVLWDLVDKFGITILGTGAKWLSVLNEKGVHPGATHKLTSLHSILSTGSPLTPASYDYVYSKVKADLLLGSITGGTDIISCFAGQNMNLPVYRGEVQARNLGMAVESWNEDGKPVYGESGEVVCTKPFPSMPTHFWADPDGFKYKKAYFVKFKGVWAHGDFCTINPKTGGILMQGRSDGTLNPNGVRFGSSDIYNIVERLPEIQDSLCVPQRNCHNEERVILFLMMTDGHQVTKELLKKIRGLIRSELSARHVPEIILQTRDIPYTLSGKKVEVAVKKIIAGQKITQRGAYRNPESLDLYSNLAELEGFSSPTKIPSSPVRKVPLSPSSSISERPAKRQMTSVDGSHGDAGTSSTSKE